jgi:two-component system nitrogen regulation sensor histidine kinase GlnL
MSASVLCRRCLTDVVAFGSPLIALVEQVQRNGTTVNEYGVDLGSFRFEAPKLVDLYAGPLAESPDSVMIMLQQRSMAQMIERQLTHRGAARSVSGLAAVLAHEIKNPLSGIRGAAQLLESERTDNDRTLTQLICAESDRICKLVDRMEIFGDERPLLREPVRNSSISSVTRSLSPTTVWLRLRSKDGSSVMGSRGPGWSLAWQQWRSLSWVLCLRRNGAAAAAGGQ